MKFKDLIKFIEDEIQQTSKPVEVTPIYKPVTINIKREDKTQREKDLEEFDFEEIMFKKLDESILRNKIHKILTEYIK